MYYSLTVHLNSGQLAAFTKYAKHITQRVSIFHYKTVNIITAL